MTCEYNLLAKLTVVQANPITVKFGSRDSLTGDGAVDGMRGGATLRVLTLRLEAWSLEGRGAGGGGEAIRWFASMLTPF